MTRDTFDFMDERAAPPGRFGDSKRDNEASKSDLVDLDLLLCGQTPLAIGVRADDKPGGKYTWLPKSQCEYTITSRGKVKVTLPSWLARDKGLV